MSIIADIFVNSLFYIVMTIGTQMALDGLAEWQFAASLPE